MRHRPPDNKSYEARTDRVTARVLATSKNIVSFSKTARAAILAGAGEMGRACKVAFTFGLETDPEVVATFLKKLTLQSRHNGAERRKKSTED